MTNASFISSLKAIPRELKNTLLGHLVIYITFIMLLRYEIHLVLTNVHLVSFETIGNLLGTANVLFSGGFHWNNFALWLIVLSAHTILLLLIVRSIYLIAKPQLDSPNRIIKTFSAIAFFFILLLGYRLFTIFYDKDLLQHLSFFYIFLNIVIWTYLREMAKFRLLKSVAKYYGNNAAPSKFKIINDFNLHFAKFNNWEITNTSKPSSPNDQN